MSEGESCTDTAQEETHRRGGILNEEDCRQCLHRNRPVVRICSTVLTQPGTPVSF